MITEFNSLILKQASKLKYSVADQAPNTIQDLIQAPTLVVWSGQSDKTVWNEARVNWAFRALHDALHLETGLGFTPQDEIELGRIQASRYDSQLLQDLIYIEVSGQAEHYLKTGQFVVDQVEFAKINLKKLGYNLKF